MYDVMEVFGDIKLACNSLFLLLSQFLSLLTLSRPLTIPPAADVLQPPTECYVIGMNAKSSMPHTQPSTVCLVRGE